MRGEGRIFINIIWSETTWDSYVLFAKFFKNMNFYLGKIHSDVNKHDHRPVEV